LRCMLDVKRWAFTCGALTRNVHNGLETACPQADCCIVCVLAARGRAVSNRCARYSHPETM